MVLPTWFDHVGENSFLNITSLRSFAHPLKPVALLGVFELRIVVGSKTSRVGSEGTTRAKGTILGWGVFGSVPHLGDS